jgi:hypothetical protein
MACASFIPSFCNRVAGRAPQIVVSQCLVVPNTCRNN